ncbi:MAG: hypothetical protein Kow00121_22090 [Elainellaceae cyanobacterium]
MKHLSLLAGILTASMISTAIHYTDNALFIADYPQPDGITLTGIAVSWILLTAIGALGYWFYRQQNFWVAYVCLFVYSLTGLSSLGHYWYGAFADFSAKMHLFIWLDGLVGATVLGFALWSAFVWREPEQKAKRA